MVRKLIVLAILIGCSFLSSEFAFGANAPISKVTVKEYIVKHSVEMGIDPALALSIAKHESNFRHELKSPYGAVGVFQLLPSTAKRMGYNPYYLSDNIKGGLKYYQMMYKKFGSVELALAAYNAGPGNVARYNGMPPFKETKVFVNQIMSEYRNQKSNPDPVLKKYKESKAKKADNILKPSSNQNQIKEVSNIEQKENSEDTMNVKDLLSSVKSTPIE